MRALRSARERDAGKPRRCASMIFSNPAVARAIESAAAGAERGLVDAAIHRVVTSVS